MKKLCLLLLIALPICSFAVHTIPVDTTNCDLIELQNGYTLEVEILRSEENAVYFKMCGEENLAERSFEKHKIKRITFAADRKPKENCETLILYNGTSYDVKIVNIKDSIVNFKICGRENAKIRTVHLKNVKEKKYTEEKTLYATPKGKFKRKTPDYSNGDVHWTTSFIVGFIVAPTANLILLVRKKGNFLVNSFIISFGLLALAAFSQFNTKYTIPTLKGILLGCVLGLTVLLIGLYIFASL